jgi:hypothetical protein
MDAGGLRPGVSGGPTVGEIAIAFPAGGCGPTDIAAFAAKR